jgi:hypothetical protein
MRLEGLLVGYAAEVCGSLRKALSQTVREQEWHLSRGKRAAQLALRSGLMSLYELESRYLGCHSARRRRGSWCWNE